MDIHTVENVFIECVLLICQWISKEVKKRNGQRNWCVLLMPQKLFGLVTCKGSLKACFFFKMFVSLHGFFYLYTQLNGCVDHVI